MARYVAGAVLIVAVAGMSMEVQHGDDTVVRTTGGHGYSERGLLRHLVRDEGGKPLPTTGTPTPAPLPEAVEPDSESVGHAGNGEAAAGGEGAVAGLLGRSELAALVASYFPEDGRMSNHVVWAESMGDWAGDNWVCNVYGPCMSPTNDCGLMQVHWPVWGGYFGWDVSQCFDPVRNLEVARVIYDRQGGRAWASY